MNSINKGSLNSRIYKGKLVHRRFVKPEYKFIYKKVMAYIDLDEVDNLSENVRFFGRKSLNALRFSEKDYLRGHSGNLKDSVIKKAKNLADSEGLTNYFPHLGSVDRVMLLCELRMHGVYFSPLNIYYLFDSQGSWLGSLAEVSNTPWNERYYYLVPNLDSLDKKFWEHDKEFHVSPFNHMNQRYRWLISKPEDNLFVHIEVINKESSIKEFDATLKMVADDFNKISSRAFLSFSESMRNLKNIYWQGIKIKLRGGKFYPHPKSKS